MRYPASEKLEIIRLVERSHLPVTRTLGMLGIPRTTFYRWYDRYQTEGPQALEDRSPKPARVWNRVPDEVRKQVVQLALDEPELSPRELAARFTDTEGYFISVASGTEVSLYRPRRRNMVAARRCRRTRLRHSCPLSLVNTDHAGTPGEA